VIDATLRTHSPRAIRRVTSAKPCRGVAPDAGWCELECAAHLSASADAAPCATMRAAGNFVGPYTAPVGVAVLLFMYGAAVKAIVAARHVNALPLIRTAVGLAAGGATRPCAQVGIGRRKPMLRLGSRQRRRAEIACIDQLVEVEPRCIGSAQPVAYKVGASKTRAARNQDHEAPSNNARRRHTALPHRMRSTHCCYAKPRILPAHHGSQSHEMLILFGKTTIIGTRRPQNPRR
jgi:hypothetical protein